MSDKFLYCIVQNLPDGLNYFCGVSKIKLPSGWAIGIEWSKDKSDASKYVSRETANKDMKDIVLPDNPFARVEPLEKKLY